MRPVVAPMLACLLLLCTSALLTDNAQALSGPAREPKCESRFDDGNIAIERMSYVVGDVIIPQLLTKKCVCGRWVDLLFVEFGTLCGNLTWTFSQQNSYRPLELGGECYPFEERVITKHRYADVVCSEPSSSSSSSSLSSGSTSSPGTETTQNANQQKCAIGVSKEERRNTPHTVNVPGAPPRIESSQEVVDSVDTRPISSINPETGQCEVGWENVRVEGEPV